MFAGVNEKLKRAEYFLNNLRALADGFTRAEKQQEMRANLDGFFFEIISAKDFFLQGINDNYGLGLPKKQATNTARLIGKLGERNLNNALNMVTSIKKLLNEENLRPEQKLLDDQDSWLWRLKNYRDSATHRELLHFGHKAEIGFATDDRELFEKIRQGRAVIKPILEGQKRKITPGVPKLDVQRKNIKTYLFKDPEDSSQGNADIEVIPYCEQSLTRMKEFLNKLYSDLELA